MEGGIWAEIVEAVVVVLFAEVVLAEVVVVAVVVSVVFVVVVVLLGPSVEKLICAWVWAKFITTN